MYICDYYLGWTACAHGFKIMLMAKRKAASPRRKGVNLNVWLPRALGEALEQYVETLRPRTDKTSIVEMLLEDFLAKQGVWPPSSSP